MMGNCNQEKGGGKPWSRLQLKGSLATTSTRKINEDHQDHDQEDC